MKNQVKIVTDSTADLPKDLVLKYGITVVPLKVIFNDEEPLKDGVDIDTDQFYRRQVANKEIARTSQPAPAEFLEVYNELSKDGHSIISIHISSAMSGTSQSAKMAKEMLPGSDIEIIDSKVTSMGLGLIALEAAREAGNGKTKNEIVDLVNTLVSKIQVFFVVDTLEYLVRGGRIGMANALLGTILSIKPLLFLKDGVVQPYEKVRGKSRAIERLVQVVEDKVGSNKIKCCLIHGMESSGLEKLRQKVSARLNCEDTVVSTLGAVIGTHTGPGVVGIAFFVS